MSCAYRGHACRRSVRPSASTFPLPAWGAVSHPAGVTNVSMSTDSSPHHDETAPFSWLSWGVFRDLLHASDSLIRDKAWSLFSIRFLQDQWAQAVTDEDIMALWQMAVSRIVRGLHYSPELNYHLFIRASESCRSWMWETFYNAYTGHESVAKKALDVGIPLWMVPGGIDILNAAFDDRPADMEALHYVVHHLPVSDPGIREMNRLLLREVLVPRLQRSADDADLWTDDLLQAQAIEVVKRLVSIDPGALGDIPALADAIFAACLSDSPDVVHAALDVLASASAFFSPLRYTSILEHVFHRHLGRKVGEQAVKLLRTVMEYDLGLTQRIVDRIWDTMTDPTVPWERRLVACRPIGAVAQVSSAVPIIATYLHTRPLSDMGQWVDIVRMLAQSPHAVTVGRDLIACVERLLHTEYADTVVEIIPALWGMGYDRDIVDVIRADMLRAPRPYSPAMIHRWVSSLLPGVYASQVGAQVVDLITSLAPDRASAIIKGMQNYYRDGKRIPPDVLPVVRDIWRTYTEPLPDTVLRALWASDPDTIRSILPLRWKEKRSAALRELTSLWDVVDNATMEALIRETVFPELRRGADTSLMLFVCDGIGRGDPATVLHVGLAVLAAMPVKDLKSFIEAVAHRERRFWERRDSWITVRFLQEAYDRCMKRSSGKSIYRITKDVLASLQYGWGYRCDEDIGMMVQRIVRSIGSHQPTDTLTLQSLTEHLVRVLCYGWGHETDATIGAQFLNLMDWLDRNYTDWTKTDIASWLVWGITTGGGDPSRRNPTRMEMALRPAISMVRNALRQRLQRSSSE